MMIALSFSKISFADGHQIYGPYPITLKGYDGDKTNSVKYTGQMARQVLHDSLKKLVKTGDLDKMMAYYNGEDGLEIIAPKSKDGFPVMQTMVAEIGSGNLSGKMYKGAIPGWGGLTGPETISHIPAITSKILPPDLAIKEGFVVTPSSNPVSASSLISSRSAVSIKNFIAIILSI